LIFFSTIKYTKCWMQRLNKSHSLLWKKNSLEFIWKYSTFFVFRFRQKNANFVLHNVYSNWIELLLKSIGNVSDEWKKFTWRILRVIYVVWRVFNFQRTQSKLVKNTRFRDSFSYTKKSFIENFICWLLVEKKGVNRN